MFYTKFSWFSCHPQHVNILNSVKRRPTYLLVPFWPGGEYWLVQLSEYPAPILWWSTASGFGVKTLVSAATDLLRCLVEGGVSLLLRWPSLAVLSYQDENPCPCHSGQTCRWGHEGVYSFLEALLWKKLTLIIGVNFMPCNGSAVVAYVVHSACWFFCIVALRWL